MFFYNARVVIAILLWIGFVSNHFSYAVGEDSELMKSNTEDHQYGYRDWKCFDDHFTVGLNKYLIYDAFRRRKTDDDDTVWIKLVLAKSGLCIITSDRVQVNLKNEAGRLVAQMKKANKKGGRSAKALSEEWMQGHSLFTFKVFYTEVSTKSELLKKIATVEKEKEDLRKELVESEMRRNFVQTELQETKCQVSYYKEQFRQAVRTVMAGKGKRRGPSKNKLFSDLSPRQQKRVKLQLNDSCQTALSFLGCYNFVATKIEVFNFDTEKYDYFDLVQDKQKFSTCKGSIDDEDIDTLNMILYVKENFNISDKSFKELSMLCPSLPRFYKITDAIRKLNAGYEIKPCPNGIEGVQTSFKKLITECCMNLEKEGQIENDVKVKFSGDGTWIGKHLHVVNFTFTLLNEGDKAMSHRGNYCLAILKIRENYDDIKAGLEDVIKEVKNTSHIVINDRHIQLTFFIGGDWKFLACVCGIGAANSDYACIWCTCKKNERGQPDKSWSLTDETLGARTIQKIATWSKKGVYGCKHQPLFDFVPMRNVVIDTLHLFLRISDVLLQHFLADLKRMHSIEKKTLSAVLDGKKSQGIIKFEEFLQKDLKINFSLSISKESKKIECRDLTGPEKLKLFHNICIRKFLEDENRAKAIQDIWDTFFKLINKLKLDIFNKEDLDNLPKELIVWLNSFLDVYQSKDVTPYMHAFVYHVPEFIALHGNINRFNQQGLEKFNDVSTQIFFHGSNMRGLEALKQAMLKRNRIRILEAEGYRREKKAICCRNCSRKGHSILTCSENCKYCEEAVCCRHLTKVGSTWVTLCSQVHVMDQSP